MKRILTLLACILIALGSSAQNDAVITFTAANSLSVKIYKPMDGAHQYEIISEEFLLDSASSATRTFEVDGFSVIRVIMRTERIVLFLFPGDHLALSYADGLITVSGSNAEAHAYYDRQFGFEGSKKYRNRMEDSVMKTNDFENMVLNLENTLLKEVRDSIDILQKNPHVYALFPTLLWQDISLGLYQQMYRYLKSLHENRFLSDPEIAKAIEVADNIIRNLDVQNLNILKLSSGREVIRLYYAILWEKASEQEKEECLQGYGSDIYAHLGSYFLMPHYLRLPMLGYSLFLEQLFNPDGSLFSYKIDLKRAYENLKRDYPQSDYVAALAKDFETPSFPNSVNHGDSISFVLHPISLLSELSTIPDLKGRYLWVDLWATWCFPCRQEFAYKDKVKKILDAYTNIKQVYISIDEDERNDFWKSSVEKLLLKGYHLRAQKALIDDIKAKVYQANPLSIPRYLLISPTGELLSTDLPRPSASLELDEVLKKHMK